MDIALRWDDERQRADFGLESGDLAVDGGLETAVLVSLFTDREALPGDLPEGEDRRGWWGDGLSASPGDRIGSRLWLLRRETLSARTIQRAIQYAREALEWLIEDGVASAVEVTAEALPARSGALSLVTVIDRPGAVPARWTRTWEVHLRAV